MTQRLKLAAACLLLIFGALAFSLTAQQPTDPGAQTITSGPYRVGERLTYSISFSNFISAAHVELLVAGRGTFFGREGIQLKGHVETTGVVNVALFAINNDYTTYVDPATGLPYRSEQTIRETERTAATFADFNQPAVTGELAVKSNAAMPGTYDLLSAIYRVRTLPLTDGSSYSLNVQSEKENYQIELRVTGVDRIKTSVGSFDTKVCQVRLKNESRGNTTNLKVYFSDDPRHVPVLITSKLSAGEIRAELAGSAFVVPTPPAQPAATPTPASSGPPRTPVVIPGTPEADSADLKDLPFKIGEQLNYQVFLPNIPAAVGNATFHVRARSKYFDHDGLFFKLTAQTTNALQKVFVANDTIASYVDPKTLLPFHTEIVLNEGRRRSNSTLTINQDYGSATTEAGAKIEIPVGTHDYLSFFYMVRTFNLSPPKRNAISILVGKKPKTLFITALKREPLQLASQTIPAIQISLTTDDAQGDKYQLRAWISDDKRRLPLRLTALTELGLVRADLAIIPVTTQ